MNADLGGVVIDEVADPVMRDAPELRPFAKGADRGLAARRENAAGTEADDVGELGGEAGSGNGGMIHAQGAVSTGGGRRGVIGTKKPAPVMARAGLGGGRSVRDRQRLGLRWEGERFDLPDRRGGGWSDAKKTLGLGGCLQIQVMFADDALGVAGLQSGLAHRAVFGDVHGNERVPHDVMRKVESLGDGRALVLKVGRDDR